MTSDANLRECFPCEHRKGMTCAINGKSITANATTDDCPDEPTRFTEENRRARVIALPIAEKARPSDSPRVSGWSILYPPAIRDELTMEHVNRARAHAPRVCGGDALTEWMSKPGNALPETDQLAYVLRMQLAIDGRRFTREQAIAKWDVVGGMTPID